MYSTESEQSNTINMLVIGVVILVLAIVGIVMAYNHQRDESATQVNTYETTQPADTVNSSAMNSPAVAPAQPPQIIQVDRPVVEQVPVPVPVKETHTNTIVKEVPAARNDNSRNVPLHSATEENVTANPTPSSTNGPSASDFANTNTPNINHP